MPNANWRSSAAMALLFALLVPILAACGGAASTPAADATAPAAADATAAPAADATAAPAADATAAAPEAPAGGTGTAEAGVLRINTGSEPDNVDPQKSSFTTEIQFIMMAYQGLMTFDNEMQPVPGYAESVEASADGLTYTF